MRMLKYPVAAKRKFSPATEQIYLIDCTIKVASNREQLYHEFIVIYFSKIHLLFELPTGIESGGDPFNMNGGGVHILPRSLYCVQLFLVVALLNYPSSYGYINIDQYCKAFDVNFKPIICLLRNGTNSDASHYHPPPPSRPPPPPRPTEYPILHPFPGPIDYSDDDDDECSCEVTCVPRLINQRSLNEIKRTKSNIDVHKSKRYKRSTTTSYRCRSCGTECSVSTNKQPMCNCVIPASKAQCNCSATCASFRFNPFHFANTRDDPDDANCILSVNALEDWRLGEERPPYVCECKRSKEAENTTRPDFICVCERVSNE